MNKIANLYHFLYDSKEKDEGYKIIQKFFNNYNIQNQDNKNAIYDLEIVNKYIKEPQFIEDAIIKHIFNMKHINLDIEYLALYAKQMNASAKKADKDMIIFVDELLNHTALSFFLTIYSYAHNKSKENTERCVKNLYYLLEIQGKKNMIYCYDISEIFKMIELPKNIIDLAMDTFWVVWTFIIGHELFHLTLNKKLSAIQEEYNADAYGYDLLLHMIQEQKKGKVPEDIKVYYEYLYLAPIMFFEYFILLDEYRSLTGIVITYSDHPSPQSRKDYILEMFDTHVPDDFDTEQGNELLNIFLDSLESLKNIVFNIKM